MFEPPGQTLQDWEQLMIVLRTTKKSGKLATAEAKNLLMHTLVLGQSGSGKSFFLVRLIEEILLRTGARVIAIDPNGDYESFYGSREDEFWGNKSDPFGKTLAYLHKLQKSSGNVSYDEKQAF